jgi:pSer/pThr/pTyr-binding forkhead associated (FHA) protein
MQVNLVVVRGRHGGERITLPRTQFVVGRDDTCHLRPVSTDVSKFHCAIARLGSRVLLRDLKSTNGTFLNGERITRTVTVNHGDLLRIGPLEFRVEFDADSPVERPSDSHLGWLLRDANAAEEKVLDPAAMTTILPGPLPAHLLRRRETTGGPNDPPSQATIVAGKFLREYLASRKRKKP